jgi:hypothetical protein
MEKIIRGFVLMLFTVIISIAFIVSVNWYFSIPVVNMTPDGNIVSIEIEGKIYQPDEVKIGSRYIKKYDFFQEIETL